jgi:hypothetical protein
MLEVRLRQLQGFHELFLTKILHGQFVIFSVRIQSSW